jgi:hypothetical protein
MYFSKNQTPHIFLLVEVTINVCRRKYLQICEETKIKFSKGGGVKDERDKRKSFCTDNKLPGIHH